MLTLIRVDRIISMLFLLCFMIAVDVKVAEKDKEELDLEKLVFGDEDVFQQALRAYEYVFAFSGAVGYVPVRVGCRKTGKSSTLSFHLSRIPLLPAGIWDQKRLRIFLTCSAMKALSSRANAIMLSRRKNKGWSKLALRLWAANYLLMKGWEIVGYETLGVSRVMEENSSLFGKTPAPRVLHNQLDSNLELYIARTEPDFLKALHSAMQKTKPQTGSAYRRQERITWANPKLCRCTLQNSEVSRSLCRS